MSYYRLDKQYVDDFIDKVTKRTKIDITSEDVEFETTLRELKD